MPKHKRNRRAGNAGAIVSLFCGAGGFDLGFEEAGFAVDVAIDLRADSIQSYNQNRSGAVAHVFDVREATVASLDKLAGKKLAPIGVIGGPPCQSFSRATFSSDDDPRHELPLEFSRLLKSFNRRSPVSFFAFENVPGLLKLKHRRRFQAIIQSFESAGFNVFQSVLNASSFGVAQNRPRLILIGLNKSLFPNANWTPPLASHEKMVTVRDAIGGLAAPQFWARGLNSSEFPAHPNHWCMVPKSQKFRKPGVLVQGTSRGRSFKVLSWGALSPTIAYGNREVHIHPSGKRRLSVYEALLLQGFPPEYELVGSLSSQISQVSEAVPPPFACAIAESVLPLLRAHESPRKRAA